MQSNESTTEELSVRTDDLSLARVLAAEAGHLLKDLQSRALQKGISRHELRKQGDATSQEFLSRELGRFRSGDSVLSEEAADNLSRLDSERVWIIDPLDGTSEYSQGRGDWAVHVALWAHGKLSAGAVALPSLGTVLDSGSAGTVVDGAASSAQTISQPKSPRRLRVAVSRSRLSTLVNEVGNTLGAEFVPMGSAGYKAGAVVRGEVDAYLHSGGQYEWDSAAPAAVALGHGFHVSTLDGAPLDYNQRDPYMPDLLICRPEVSALVLLAVRQCRTKTNDTKRSSV